MTRGQHRDPEYRDDEPRWWETAATAVVWWLVAVLTLTASIALGLLLALRMLEW